MLKIWVDQKNYMKPRTYFRRNDQIVEHYLNDDYTKIDTVPGLKTSLFPHQKTIIRAMLDLEIKRKFVLYEYDKWESYQRHGSSQPQNNNFEIKISAGVLSEAVGSGKTIDILSVILLQKYPKVYPDITSLNLFNDKMLGYSDYGKQKFSCCIRKKFSHILKTTIVFVGVSVVNQWINAIKTFTSLKYFIVFDVRDLQKLINCMFDKSINNYDIIIVKNGKVTRPIVFPDEIIVENKNLKSIIPIYNIIANMRNFCWFRVVIDDFDTIKLPYNAGIVNGLFTWYISSTKKYSSRGEPYNNQFNTTSDMLMYSNYNCSNIMNNPIMFYNLNIRNDPKFVEETNNINSAKFYAYTFHNPNDQYIGFLSLMGGDEAHEIMEMLNGDAIETAAEKIGIKTNKVADIFQIMLGKQYELYKKSINILEFINEIEPMQGNRLPMSSNPDLDDTYKKSDLFIKREIKYNYPNLKSIIDTTKEEYTIIRQTSSISIERVKNNIKEGECPVCLGELDDEDEEILIAKCCGVIVCGSCCFGTIFPKNSAIGQCAKCRKQLKLYDLIYLNKGFDLNKIIDENTDDDVDDEKKIIIKCKPYDKMNSIINIINGIKIPERFCVDVNIPNLMKGNNILPEKNYNKVLIFANYDETIKKTIDKLTDEKIKFWKLGGSHSEINNIVEKFTNCNTTCVMIINSMKHCSGLNLQTATDLIFTHKIIDQSIETQVIGRGQRLGRTSTLKVHYLMYKNEYDWMIKNNTIRTIVDN
jgi:SNF2 family DNA or RNA helicase